MSFTGYVRKITKQGPAAIATEVRCIPWADSCALLGHYLLEAGKTCGGFLACMLVDTARIAVPITALVVVALFLVRAMYPIN